MGDESDQMAATDSYAETGEGPLSPPGELPDLEADESDLMDMEEKIKRMEAQADALKSLAAQEAGGSPGNGPQPGAPPAQPATGSPGGGSQAAALAKLGQTGSIHHVDDRGVAATVVTAVEAEDDEVKDEHGQPGAPPAGGESADQQEVDKRSVYLGNVDYATTPEELLEHFKSCGPVNRITILVDKYSGNPKGYAYIEFGDEDGVVNSLMLNGSLFRGRQLKVTQKRTNQPGQAKGKTKKGKGKGKGKKGYYEGWEGGWYGYGGYKPKGKGKAKGYSPY